MVLSLPFSGNIRCISFIIDSVQKNVGVQNFNQENCCWLNWENFWHDSCLRLSFSAAQQWTRKELDTIVLHCFLILVLHFSRQTLYYSWDEQDCVLLPNIEIVEGGYPPDKKFLTYLWSSLSHVSESRLIIETPEGKNMFLVFSFLYAIPYI